jgi:hypothetical protein
MNISYRKAFLLGLATASLAQAAYSANPDRFSGMSPQSSFVQQTAPRQSWSGQQRLRDVKTIFVDSLGNSNDSQVIRDKTINRLIKAGFSIADQPEQADAVLTGTAFVRATPTSNGYMNVDKNNGFATMNSGVDYTPVFSVRLLGRNGQILWTTESRFRLIHSLSVTSNAADQIVKDLMKSLGKPGKRG